MPHLPTPDSPRVIIIRLGVCDTDLYTIQETMKVTNMMNDILLRSDDNMMIAGEIGLIDMAKASISELLHINPSFIKRMSILNQNASPIRLKALHFINTPLGFTTALNMFRGLMTEKNRKKLLIHSHGNDLESLHKFIPKSILPKEYGGEAGTIDDLIADWVNILTENRDFLIEDEKYGVDESKRIGKSSVTEAVTNGIEGTFRKLEID